MRPQSQSRAVLGPNVIRGRVRVRVRVRVRARGGAVLGPNAQIGDAIVGSCGHSCAGEC